MRKNDFNKGWKVRPLNSNQEWKEVSLPHDAMISENRSSKSIGRHNIGWFEGLDYEYVKTFFVDEDTKNKHQILEFEGVYHNADVYINGEHAIFHPYGYTEFSLNLDTYLKYGQENEIKVIARNSDQPNSRWYSGTGIYRPVWLYQLPESYILQNGVKISTLSINPAKIQVEVLTSEPGQVSVEIGDGQYVVASGSGQSDGRVAIEIEIPDAKLWDLDSPSLYQAIVSFGLDKTTESFGIRTIEYGPEVGLALNGKRVILKGACIHHDNGILGACAFPEAEERKVRIHKAQGYNALRMAHNPCSRAMLEACDRLGMLVMDEYVDCWYIHKTKYDYVNYLKEWWKTDLKDIVNKDFNHPSVIMYSTGNEVAETGEKEGINLTEDFTNYLHSLDSTRPVSCGINIFFNFLYSAGFGVYSDDKSEKELADAAENKKPVGSEFYNTLAGIFGDTTMKIGAWLHMSDVKTRDAFARMDIAGYNYGLFRYKKDLKKYPNRLILGSETFCRDTWAWYRIAENNKRIIGDFVWAGQDYIGEAGIGAWEYEQYAPKNAPKEGWLTAGSGRIDIIGNTLGEAAYTRVVYKAQDKPAIAVKPLCDIGKHSPSAWKMSEARESWSYRGFEGKVAMVEVYARGYKVELILNGKKIGSKKINKTMRTYFKVPYENGRLTAIVYDNNGNKVSENSLVTAGEETKLSIEPEKMIANPEEIIFVPINYTDNQGILKPTENHNVTIDVEGGQLLGFGNACAYNPDGYCSKQTFTYYGQLLAAVRAADKGQVKIVAWDENRKESVTIPIATR